jgi:hypothetical protein
MHGGALSEQLFLLAVIPYLYPFPTQQLDLPPGKLAQPGPPQVPQLLGQHTFEPPTDCVYRAATFPSIPPAAHEPGLTAAGGGGWGLALGQLHRLVWAHLGGVVQYFCMAQPATLKPGASPRHVELHATSQRLDLPAALHVGTSGAFVGGHVHTLPLAHDGVEPVQYFCTAQPATLKPGADPRHVDTHASSHMAALPIEAHDGATASIWVVATAASLVAGVSAGSSVSGGPLDWHGHSLRCC